MATTVDTLLVEIRADMDKLKRDLNKVSREMDTFGERMRRSFRKVGTGVQAIIGGLVVREMARGAYAAVKLASDVEEMQSKSSVVFRQFADDVRQALGVFADETGRNRFELEGFAAGFQDTLVPMGLMRGEAAKLSVELTKLAVDLGSFNNMRSDEVFQSLQSAIVGNHETMRRFGVVITETTLKQKLMEMGINGGTQAATEQEKIMARLAMITEGTSDAQGDATRTADSFANMLVELKSRFSLLASELGQTFMPAAKAIVDILTQLTNKTRLLLADMGVISIPAAEELANLTPEIEAAEQTVAQLLSRMNNGQGLTMQEFLALPDSFFAGGGGYAELGRLVKDHVDEMERMKTRALELQTEIALAAGGGDAEEEAAGPDRSFTALDKKSKKLYEEIAAMQLRLEAEKKYTEAVKTGNKEEIRKAQLAQENLKTTMKMTDMTGYAEDAYNQLVAEFGYGNDLIDGAILKHAALSMALDGEKDAASAASDAIKDYQDLIADGVDIYREHTNSAFDLEQQIKALNAAYAAKAIDMPEYQKVLAELNEEIKELNPVYARLKDQANDMFDKVADSLTDMVMRGKMDLQSLKAVFKDTMREMIADAVKTHIIKKALGVAFGAIGGAMSGSSNAIISSAGDFIGSIGKAAGGGDIDGPTLVGERGPELFVPHSAGTILNNHNTKNAVGGGGLVQVIQNLNISTGVSQTVRAEVRAMMPQIAENAKNAVLDGKRRGGTFGRGMA